MSQEFWNDRWKNKETGWDIGSVSPPLKEYIDQLTDKSIQLLIPGCGNAYEAEYLIENGFYNTHIVEISELAITSFLERYPDFPKDQIHHCDFFDFSGKFDRIIEQTFFCALTPDLREGYSKKMHDLLKENGKLIGLLFDFPLETGPPYGGSEKEYRELFSQLFTIETLASCYNSIKPRAGREFFICLTPKN